MFVAGAGKPLMLWLAIAAIHPGNAQVQTPAATPPAFEVASIKPADLFHPNPLPYKIGPNTLTIPQARLDQLIEQAYEVERYQVTGGPAWVEKEFYDVQAKAETDANSHQIRAMLQTLLADRFQLKLHRETRTMAGYVLSVDKGGPKLPPPRTDVPPDSTGVIQVGGGLWARGTTIKHVAHALALVLGQPVLDQTNIQGHYDFRLRYDDPDDPSAPGSASTALHELGLRLDARKLPIEVLVIDTADRPSAN
jgi:uncharacterized protein (TIGR03435 family)